MWNLIAKLLARPRVVQWLLDHSTVTKETPHLPGYMKRYTLIPFNRFLPHVRLHHILRDDGDRHLHDHPGDYRTIILQGGYSFEDIFGGHHQVVQGDTALQRAETFHRIDRVSPGGVWTLFILYKWRNRWGFLVGGHKIYYRDYLEMPE